MANTNIDEQESMCNMVFDRLFDEILNGTYAPGEILIEAKISENLGVSKALIKDAIKRLELEGMVTSLPNKRVLVQGVTDDDINDIYIIRKRLEGLAAKLATINITESELDMLKNTVELMEYYTAKEEMHHIQNLDSQFHDIIFQASKSRPLRCVLANFHQLIKKAREISIMVPGRLPKALEEHKIILKAIEDKDPQMAEEAMIKHILGAKKNLLSHKKNKSEAKNKTD